MIFLSHNSKDKAIVEPIALKLRDEFGQDNVFYDSWSIQPGEGIIAKMNEGIEKCEVCYYFVSANSLSSFMVNLEWQNVLMKMSKGKAKLIPVRIDNCDMPAILTQSLYIDLYTIGIDKAIDQIIDSAKGNNTFKPKYETAKNLVVHMKPSYGTHIEIKIEAKLFPVQNTKFVFLSQASQGEVSYDSKHLLYREFGYKEDFLRMESPAISLNAFMLDFRKPLEPGFPLYAEFNSNTGKAFSIMFVYHERREGEWEMVEMQVDTGGGMSGDRFFIRFESDIDRLVYQFYGLTEEEPTHEARAESNLLELCLTRRRKTKSNYNHRRIIKASNMTKLEKLYSIIERSAFGRFACKELSRGGSEKEQRLKT